MLTTALGKRVRDRVPGARLLPAAVITAWLLVGLVAMFGLGLHGTHAHHGAPGTTAAVGASAAVVSYELAAAPGPDTPSSAAADTAVDAVDSGASSKLLLCVAVLFVVALVLRLRAHPMQSPAASMLRRSPAVRPSRAPHVARPRVLEVLCVSRT